jgi:mannose-6-phosphate isomerase-like protein (cupin superfamily)
MNMNVKFPPLEIIDVNKISAECREDWFNQTLAQVNDCVVRLGIVKGEFHWHKHDKEDEFFYVVSGKLIIDLEGKSVELAPQQGFTIPRGVLHRTRAAERTVMLMLEGKTIKPTGD